MSYVDKLIADNLVWGGKTRSNIAAAKPSRGAQSTRVEAAC